MVEFVAQAVIVIAMMFSNTGNQSKNSGVLWDLLTILKETSIDIMVDPLPFQDRNLMTMMYFSCTVKYGAKFNFVFPFVKKALSFIEGQFPNIAAR